MPMSKYDRHFGGKKGSAAKAKEAMEDEYGEEKGERVFYATKNKRKGLSARHAAMALGRRRGGGKGCCPGGK